MKRTLLLVLVLLVVLAACSPAPTPAPTAAPPTKAPVASSSAPASSAPASSSVASSAAPTKAPEPTKAPASSAASSAAPASSAAAAPTAVKATAVPVPAGATKFDFWHAMSGTNGDAINEMVGRFNASQSKCYGTAVFQGTYDDSLNKIKAGLASKDVPALAQMYDLATQLMVDLKAVEPVQTYIDKDKFDLSTFEPNVLGYYSVGGKLYGMPFNTSAPIMYYNKTLFKAAGLDPEKPPRTYAEVIDAAKKLTKKDASGKVTVAGYGIAIYGWIFEQLLATSGGYYLNNGNGRDARATAAAFNSPEGIAAVQFWKDAIDSGAAQNFGVAPNGTNALVAAFQSQQVAMYIESTARVRAMIDTSVANKFDLGTAYLPRPNEDAYKKAGVIIGGASVYIMKDRSDAEKNCAWEFVKFSTSPEIQAYWHTASGYYPVTKKAYDIQIDKDWVTKYPQFLTAVNQLHDSPKVMTSMGGFSGTMQQNRLRIEQAIDTVLSGKATPKDALDAAAKDVTQNISDYNKTVAP
jgi:sn-glycerol 3-phosphate transport system substrate-binding protein